MAEQFPAPPTESYERADDNRRRWMIIGVIAFLVIGCCLFLVAAWFLGDYVIEWLGLL
jgi:hypothetical protein